MRLEKLLVSACLALVCQAAFADGTYVSGRVVALDETTMRMTAVAGADVSLVAEGDTLKVVTDKTGAFEFSIDPVFEVGIQVKCLGYGTYRGSYQIADDRLLVMVRLLPEAEILEGAAVSAEATLMKIRQDTVSFNAAALSTMPGDKAISLLTQIPGVSIQNGKILLWGEPVTKTYVNGKLLFGDNPMSAFAKLNADEVRAIDTFERQSSLDKRKGLRHSRKERVMDIKTFESFLSASEAVAQARGGAVAALDEDGRLPLRHAAGGDFSYSSEMLQYSISANSNNINDDSNDFGSALGTASALKEDRLHRNLSASLTKKWKDSEQGNSLDARYWGIRDDVLGSERRVIDRPESEYVPEALHYEEFISSTGETAQNNLDIVACLRKTAVKDLRAGVSFVRNRNSLLEKSEISSLAASTGLQTQNQQSRSFFKDYSFGSNLEWSDPDRKGEWKPMVKLSYVESSGNGSDWIADTLSSSFNRRYVMGGTNGGHRYALGSVNLEKTVTDNNSYSSTILVAAGVDYKRDRKERLMIDRIAADAQQPDSVDVSNSYNYTRNDMALFSHARFSFSSSPLGFNLMAGMSYVLQKDDEFVPSEFSMDRQYLYPVINADARVNLKGNILTFSAFSRGSVPSVEQTRNRIDDRNPFRLQMGNPDLKAPVSNSFSLSYRSRPSVKGSSFYVVGQLKHTRNMIVDKITYFSESAEVPFWGANYLVPAGATLTSFENSGRNIDLYANANYSARIKKIRGTMTAGFSYNYQKLPQYIGNGADILLSSRPAMTVSASSVPIANAMRLMLSGNLGYIGENSLSGQTLAKVLNARLSSAIEVRFLKYCFWNTRYGMSGYHYLSGTGSDMTLHNLDSTIGVRLLKGNMVVSLSGCDLLERSSAYTAVSTSTEFIQTWRQDYGRYLMLNLVWRLSRRS